MVNPFWWLRFGTIILPSIFCKHTSHTSKIKVVFRYPTTCGMLPSFPPFDMTLFCLVGVMMYMQLSRGMEPWQLEKIHRFEPFIMLFKKRKSIWPLNKECFKEWSRWTLRYSILSELFEMLCGVPCHSQSSLGDGSDYRERISRDPVSKLTRFETVTTWPKLKSIVFWQWRSIRRCEND
jgi:hypothetical protein